jgi:hypothetical protein
MPLNVVSNYAANVAHRNLLKTDMQASASLAKLSIGKRVVSARDDAASMAIGSRMNSEVQGLKQAVVNAGQANSMLQIADGAMSTVSDILTRMKVLAIQASSENLGDTERSFLNVEFQALTNEVNRISQDTDFNGVQLLSGQIAITKSANLGTANGVAGLSAQGVDTNGAFTIAYDGTDTFTVSDGTNSYTGTIAAGLLDTNGALTRSTTIQLTSTTGGGSLSLALNRGRGRGLHGRRHQPAQPRVQARHRHGDLRQPELHAQRDLDHGPWHDRHRVDRHLGQCRERDRGGQHRDHQPERVPRQRRRGAEPARLRIRQSVDRDRECRGGAQHAARSRYRLGDDQLHEQAGPDAVGCGDARPGQPAAGQPAASAAVVPASGVGLAARSRAPYPRVGTLGD